MAAQEGVLRVCPPDVVGGDKAVDAEGLGRPGARCGGGNYMFLQVAPSPTTNAVVPFTEYYNSCKARA